MRPSAPGDLEADWLSARADKLYRVDWVDFAG